VFNWLVGGSDGHAKNYALLHAPGGHVRLAPLYDIASALPYPGLNTPRLKLAMKYGGQYCLQRVGAREMRKLAEGMALDPDDFVDRARDMAEQLPDLARRVYDECVEQKLHHPILGVLLKMLRNRAKRCRKQLEHRTD